MNNINATINDVAREAKVSRATIDRVLYNRGYVSEDKRKAVLEAVKKLNFKPNKAAQALAINKKYKIAVVFPTAEKSFWDEVESGIDAASRELETAGVNVIKFPIKLFDIVEQSHILDHILSLDIDGLAVAPAHASKMNECLQRFIQKGIPIVTFNSDAPKSGRMCFVGQDTTRSGSLAADIMALLLARKGKVAVFRAVKDLLAIQQRIVGFTEKIEFNYPDIDIIGCYDFDESEEKAYLLTKDILDKNHDLSGIYVTNVYINVVGRALKDLNLHQKVYLVGFDITEETKNQIKEGIVDAVINQDPFIQGYKPIQILYDFLSNNQMPDNEIVNTKLEIILPGNV